MQIAHSLLDVMDRGKTRAGGYLKGQSARRGAGLFMSDI